MGALTRLLSFAFKREREEHLWEEWLAFTPIAKLTGGKVMDFRTFVNSTRKQPAPMSAIDDIRRVFKL